MIEKKMIDKVALVTGAGRGIGKAIALKLAQKGITVIGTGINQTETDVINDYFKAEKLSGYGLSLNVTSDSQRAVLYETIKEKHGHIDILVNNAGITKDNLMLRMKDEEWIDVIETNLNAIFHITKLFLRDMVKARWGRIVNISSVVAFVGNPGQANYCATKAGLLGFSKALAIEVATRNITVNCVAPGFIDTMMTQKLDESQKNAILQRIPMQTLGQPEDIAETVNFLVSDAARYITGQTIHVNGGMLMA